MAKLNLYGDPLLGYDAEKNVVEVRRVGEKDVARVKVLLNHDRCRVQQLLGMRRETCVALGTDGEQTYLVQFALRDEDLQNERAVSATVKSLYAGVCTQGFYVTDYMFVLDVEDKYVAVWLKTDKHIKECIAWEGDPRISIKHKKYAYEILGACRITSKTGIEVLDAAFPHPRVIFKVVRCGSEQTQPEICGDTNQKNFEHYVTDVDPATVKHVSFFVKRDHQLVALTTTGKLVYRVFCCHVTDEHAAPVLKELPFEREGDARHSVCFFSRDEDAEKLCYHIEGKKSEHVAVLRFDGDFMDATFVERGGEESESESEDEREEGGSSWEEVSTAAGSASEEEE